MKTGEDLTVWNMVHAWCNGLQADIPDMAKRYLMDLIEADRKQHAIEFGIEVKEQVANTGQVPDKQTLINFYNQWYTQFINSATRRAAK